MLAPRDTIPRWRRPVEADRLRCLRGGCFGPFVRRASLEGGAFAHTRRLPRAVDRLRLRAAAPTTVERRRRRRARDLPGEPSGRRLDRATCADPAPTLARDRSYARS